MNNLDIYNFKENLISLINNSNLLAGTAYYIMKDVLKDLEDTFQEGINLDYANLQKANQQKTNEKLEEAE